MKFKPEQNVWINLAILGGLVLASFGYFLTAQLPNLREHRLLMDADRASLATLLEQRDNITQYEQQADELSELQTTLSAELWPFAAEPEFFTAWDAFGRTQRVNVEVLHVADVVPSKQPVRRSAQLAIQGTPADFYSALNALAELQPLVAIQRVQVRSGSLAGQLAATIDIDTVWQ